MWSASSCAAGGATLPEFSQGAHIDLHLASGLVRSYSLCGARGARDRYTVGVLLQGPAMAGAARASCTSSYAWCSTLSIGRRRAAASLLDEGAAHTVLVAGGVGVTPIVCMARRLAERGRVHAAAAPPVRRGGGGTSSRPCRPMATPCASISAAPTGRTHAGPRGDAGGSKDSPAAFLPAAARPDAQRLREAACAATTTANVHIERLPPTRQRRGEIAGGRVQRFGSRCNTRATNVRDAVRLSPLLGNALLEAGVAMEYSCREGVCGSCETAVLDGCPTTATACSATANARPTTP